MFHMTAPCSTMQERKRAQASVSKVSEEVKKIQAERMVRERVPSNALLLCCAA